MVKRLLDKLGIYTFNLTDAAYSNAESQWDLYLYDIQTYTELTFNRNVSTSELPITSFIEGKSIDDGFAVAAGTDSDVINVYQTSGTFVADEQIKINGVDASLSLKSLRFIHRDIKSVAQNASGFPVFEADTVLTRKQIDGISQANFTNSSGIFTSPGKLFTDVKVGDVVRYQDGSNLRYNRVSSVNGNLTSITVRAITDVSGVFVGGKAGDGTYNIELAVPELKNNDNAFLYANLPDSNISSVDLSNSQLSITRQITGESTDQTGQLTFDLSSVSGITSAFFDSFDQERYSVHYNGAIGAITSDAFALNGNTVTIEGLLDLNLI